MPPRGDMPTQWEPIGVVGSVNPARRELRVRLDAGSRVPETHREWVRLELPDGTTLQCKVLEARGGPETAILRLGAGTSRDTVARLRGARAALGVEVPGETRTGFDPATWVGMRLVDAAGNAAGVIEDVFFTPAHGVFRIARPNGRTALLPAVEELIERVDFDAGVVVVGDIAPHMVEDED